MVILRYIEIDKHLDRNDFQYYIEQILTWKWHKTHFTWSHECFGCGQSHATPTGPRHLILIMNTQIAMALKRKKKKEKVHSFGVHLVLFILCTCTTLRMNANIAMKIYKTAILFFSFNNLFFYKILF